MLLRMMNLPKKREKTRKRFKNHNTFKKTKLFQVWFFYDFFPVPESYLILADFKIASSSNILSLLLAEGAKAKPSKTTNLSFFSSSTA